MKFSKRKVLLGIGAFCLVALICGAWFAHRVSRAIDMADIKAAIAARHIKDPDARLEKFFEARYGSTNDPAFRQKVFVRFFDPEHIKSMRVIMDHTPIEQRQTNIMTTARWIRHYRESMTPDEAALLRAELSSKEGQSMVQQATTLYLSQNAQYREMTGPVVGEMLKTLKSLQNP